MDSFLQLNKHKLKFAFTAVALIFLVTILALFAFLYFNGEKIENSLLVIVLLIGVIGFPIYIIVLAYFGWSSLMKKRMKAFATPPFDKLESIGFTKSLFRENAKWHFTEERKQGIINGFLIKCDISTDKPTIIEFVALAKHREIDKQEYNTLKGKFKLHQIEFNWGGITKWYDTKQMANWTILDLKIDLERFTELLKSEGFEPLTQDEIISLKLT